MQATGLCVLDHALDLPVTGNLREQQLITSQPPHVLEKRQGFRTGTVIKALLQVVWIGGEITAALGGRIIAKFGVVGVEVGDIQPQTIDPPIQPELHGIEDLGLQFLVVQVQIGLLDQKVMQVVLAALRAPLPRDSAETSQPVVGGGAVLLRVCPDIPVGFRVIVGGPTLREPGVFV